MKNPYDKEFFSTALALQKCKTKQELIEASLKQMKFMLPDDFTNNARIFKLFNTLKDVPRPQSTITAQLTALLQFKNPKKTISKLNKCIKKHDIKVTIIHGDNDKVLNIGNAIYMNKHLISSKLIILKNQNHFIQGCNIGEHLLYKHITNILSSKKSSKM